jgi:TetR/AcrR family transcriptional regulator, regulator of autoinduction and epiphytic fitness
MTVIKRGPTRRYDSRRRELGAGETRRAIVSAARGLFVDDGYVATTIEKIAERAGVSKPTVFASVGNKRALLKAARDLAMAGDDEPVPIAERSWFQEALAEPDPRQSVRLHARNVTRIHRHAGDVVEVLRAAAGADEELRTLWQTAERERRADAAVFVDALRRKGSLRAGLDRDSAIDIVWFFTGPEAFQRLVRARRWSLPRYEEWLAQTFLDQLLPPPATSPTTSAGR